MPRFDENRHAYNLGAVVGNLMSLEVLLRAAVAKLGAGEWSGPDLEKLAVGQRVPVNSMTSYDALGKIIDKYNSLVTAPHRIDRDRLVALRDAIAHGRP